MGYILDVAAILLFILAIFIGYRRGFIKSVIKLVGCVLAVVIAWGLGAVIAGGIFDAFLSDKLQATIVQQIPSSDVESVSESLNNVIDKLPGVVSNTMEAYGLGTPKEILGQIEDSLGGSVEAVASAVVTKVVRPVAVLLLRMVCFLVLFIVLMIVVGIAASIINKAFQLPVFKQVNGVLGAVIGAVEGAVLVLVAVTVVQLVANSASPDAVINRTDVEQSILVGAIADVNPITRMLDSAVRTIAGK